MNLVKQMKLLLFGQKPVLCPSVSLSADVGGKEASEMILVRACVHKCVRSRSCAYKSIYIFLFFLLRCAPEFGFLVRLRILSANSIEDIQKYQQS